MRPSSTGLDRGDIVAGHFRRTLIALLSALFMATALGCAPLATAATVLFADGATFGTPVDDPVIFRETFLGGAYRDDDVAFVKYPASVWPVTGLFTPTFGRSVDIGTTNMVDLVRSTPGPLVVSGASEGSVVAQQVQAALNGDATIPSSTTFILVANPNLGALRGWYGFRIPVLAYRPQPLAETRFSTLVVINQYDPFADPVVRPWNLLAVANSWMGAIYVHPSAQNADLATVPPENITTTTNSQGGTTTTYFVPTPQLPLTMPLRQLGVPAPLVDSIDKTLRPVIDAGYAPVRCGPAPRARQASTRTASAATSSARRRGSSSPSGEAGTSVRRSPVR